MTDYGPTSMKVKMQSQIDRDTVLTFETECVVINDDDAYDKGAQFVDLQKAWLRGFGESGNK